jgi:hypothetical protein
LFLIIAIKKGSIRDPRWNTRPTWRRRHRSECTLRIILIINSLSRWRERVGVRVDIIFPLTVALRHPVFFELSIVERDFILSPEGRGDHKELLHKANE